MPSCNLCLNSSTVKPLWLNIVLNVVCSWFNIFSAPCGKLSFLVINAESFSNCTSDFSTSVFIPKNCGSVNCDLAKLPTVDITACVPDPNISLLYGTSVPLSNLTITSPLCVSKALYFLLVFGSVIIYLKSFLVASESPNLDESFGIKSSFCFISKGLA